MRLIGYYSNPLELWEGGERGSQNLNHHRRPRGFLHVKVGDLNGRVLPGEVARWGSVYNRLARQ